MTVRKIVLRSSILPAALLALAAISPASAQYWGPPQSPNYGGRIPPQHVEEMVRSLGYQPVAEPRPRGPLWVTHAVDRDGQQVRVLIDSFSGRVIDVLRRPLPPQRVAVVPPANASPQGPMSDYEDDGPDYDYRNAPQGPGNWQQQRPNDWPPARPNALQQGPQQGPQVIPFEPRSDNNRLPAPKTNTAKKKDTKEKKNDATAALTPDKEKTKTPSPKTRPADAPKIDAPKAATPKPDAPKTAQTPKMPADAQRAADPQATGAIPPVPTFDTPKNQAPNASPAYPVQPPF